MARKKKVEEEEEMEEAAEEIEEEASGESAEEQAEPKKKKRRVIRIRKSKKEKENPLAAAIRLTVESGKVEFGFRNASKESLLGKAKVFVVASRTPQEMHDSVENYAKLAGIPTISFEGTPLDLGSACGKPFNVSVLAVYEEGASNILEIARKNK